MWRRLKSLWGGRTVDISDLDEDGAASAAPEPHQAELQPAPERKIDPVVAAIAAIDRSIATGAAADALPIMRALLLRHAADPRVIDRASRVLGALGETHLAEGFRVAGASRDPAPLVTLARAFVAMDDPEIGLALADAAVKRAPNLASAIDAVGESLAALGRHAEVIARLQPYAETWDAPILKRRYATSAILAGDWAAYEIIAEALERDPDAGPILAMAARAGAGADDAEGTPTARQRCFLRYGALLLDSGEDVEAIAPHVLSRWISSLAVLLSGRVPEDTRVAWVSPRGEVIARWLGEATGCAPIPLSARLPDQAIIVALADSDDAERLVAMKAYEEAPTILFQAALDPGAVGHPMQDVIGVLGADVALPLEALEGELARDRVPPKLLASRLMEEAAQPSAAAIRALVAWSEDRLEHLSLANPPWADERAVFVGL